MPILSGYLEAPSQGVTQASQAIRLPNQASALEQCLVEIPEGMRKRPPIDLLGTLAGMAGIGTTAAIEIIEDPNTGDLLYLILNTEAGIIVPRLFAYPSLAPVAITVTGAATTYLDTNTPSPFRDIGITRAVDFTILTNRTVTVANSGTTQAARPPEGLVFVKTATFGKFYQMTVTKTGGSPIIASVTTPNGDDANDSFWVDTDKIAQGLAGSGYSYTNDGAACTPGAAALATAGFTVTIQGPVIYLSHPTVDFTILTQDSQGGLAMDTIKDTVQEFSDLPNGDVPPGFVIKIDPQAAEGSLASGAYYLEFTNTSNYSGNMDTGLWKEVVGPGAELGLNPLTMPIALVNNAGTWTMDTLPWTQRTVGDQTLSPDPGFIGNTINDVGYSFERLALVSDEECFLAAVDNPFRCYPSTMTTEVDSDPMALETPGAARAYFYSIIPFNKTFIVFGTKKQAVIVPPTEGPVTPTATRLELLTSYETEEEDEVSRLPLRPTFSDRYAYYPMLRGPNYYAIYEIALDRLSQQPLSEDLTPHLPRYLPSTIDRAATIQSSFLIAYGISGGSDIYAHLFRYGGSGYNYQRLQNAWHHWQLAPGWTLCGLTKRATSLHFLMSDPNGLPWIGTMETAPLTLDPNPASTIQTLLDNRMTQAQVASVTYNVLTNTSVITLPHSLPATSKHRIAACAPVVAQPEGYLAFVDGFTGSTITVHGNWAATNFYIGYMYSAQWVLNTIYYVGQDGRPQHNSVMGLRRLKVDLYQTSYLGCETTVGNRASRSYSLKQTAMGTPMIFTGTWEVPVMGDNQHTAIQFINDSHLPSRVTGLEWFAEFNPKSQRVT